MELKSAASMAKRERLTETPEELEGRQGRLPMSAWTKTIGTINRFRLWPIR